MHILISDIRYALRGFARHVGFTIPAVLSLAIGIGANTALFSVANALLLRPLPYRDADRLVILWNRSPGLNIAEDWFSTAQYFDIQGGHHGFENARDRDRRQLQPDGQRRARAHRRDSRVVEPVADAGRADRTRPALQRRRRYGPARRDGRSEHGTWTRRYGSDPRVLGRSITLNGQRVPASSACCARRSRCRVEVLPTLGVRGGRRDLPSAAAAGLPRPKRASARTTTSSAS